MSASTDITEVLAALATVEPNAPIRALLAEVECTRAHISDAPVAQEGKDAADRTLALIRSYLDGDTSADQCEEEGLSLLVYTEGLSAKFPRFPTDVGCYLQACSQLAITVGRNTPEQHASIVGELLNSADWPTLDASRGALLDHLRATLYKLTAKSAISNFARSRNSLLTESPGR